MPCNIYDTFIGYADANRDPKEFTIAPADAIPLALKKCGLSMGDIDYFEINEAFSVVSIANEKVLIYFLILCTE